MAKIGLEELKSIVSGLDDRRDLEGYLEQRSINSEEIIDAVCRIVDLDDKYHPDLITGMMAGICIGIEMSERLEFDKLMDNL